MASDPSSLDPDPDSSAQDFLLLGSALCPQVRAASSGSGETTLEVLRSCAPFPDLLRPLASLCGFRARVAETDSAKSNFRAELLLEQQRHEAPQLPKTWPLLHLPCTAHRLHACATKTWQCMLPAISGATHASLLLGSAGGTRHLKQALMMLVQQRLVIKHEQLPPSAVEFRRRNLALFSPSVRRRYRHARVKVLCQQLFNGDWRVQGVVEHRCHPTCCASRNETLEKMTHNVCRLFISLGISIFSKANWVWHEALNIYGLGGAMHGLLGDAMLLAFGNGGGARDVQQDLGDREIGQDEGAEARHDGVGELLPPEGQAVAARVGQNHLNVEQQDLMERLRQQRARSRRLAMDFFHSSYHESVFIIRYLLAPQVELMSQLLHSLDDQEELRGHSQQNIRLLWWLQGHCLRAYIQDTGERLRGVAHHMPFVCSEAFRSTVWMLAARSAAVAWQLIHIPSQSYPSRLFSLIDPEKDSLEVATALTTTRICLLDEFTKAVLRAFPSVLALVSEPLKQILLAIGCQAQTCTYRIETLHSQNLRKASQRVMTHRPDLQAIAMQHCRWAGPTCLRPLPKISTKERPKRGRPKKGSYSKRSFESGEPPECAAKSKKRRGGGGSWRCFVQSQLQGRQFQGDAMTEISQRYRALPAEERLRLQGLGAHGLDASHSSKWHLVQRHLGEKKWLFRCLLVVVTCAFVALSSS